MKLEEAEAVAKEHVYKALLQHPRIPDTLDRQLALGFGPEGDHYVFVLYVPKERPQDGLVLVEARVHRVSGETTVTVYPERWTNDVDDEA